jgi:hypothetical protein
MSLQCCLTMSSYLINTLFPYFLFGDKEIVIILLFSLLSLLKFKNRQMFYRGVFRLSIVNFQTTIVTDSKKCQARPGEFVFAFILCHQQQKSN